MAHSGSLDWQSNKTLFECNKYLLESGHNSDVTFRVGKQKDPIKAHRSILSSRSCVLDRMLNGDFREANQDPILPDIDVETFEAVLRYCYYECSDVSPQVAFTTLCAAKEYMLQILEQTAREIVIQNINKENVVDLLKYSFSTGDQVLLEKCIQKSKSAVSSENIWHFYELSLKYQERELSVKCREFFQAFSVNDVREALANQAFLSIPHEVLLDFLHINATFDDIEKEYDIFTRSTSDSMHQDVKQYRHHFGISVSDIELFKACNAWAEAQSVTKGLEPTGPNKRALLKDCIELIQFRSMLQMDLVNVVFPEKILNEEEKDTLYTLGTASPTRRRYFLTKFTKLDYTLDVYCDERVILSRIWLLRQGTFTVSVENPASGSSYSKRYLTSRQNHVIERTNIAPLMRMLEIVRRQNNRLVHYIDIEPRILEAGKCYSVSIRGEHTVPGHSEPKVIEFGQYDTLDCIHIKSDGGNWTECALSLSLA